MTQEHIITKWRNEYKWSPNKLAKASGMAVSHLLLVESGATKRPGREQMIAIGIVLSRTIDDINQLLESYQLRPLDNRFADMSMLVGSAERIGHTSFPVVKRALNRLLLTTSLERNPGDVRMATFGFFHEAMFDEWEAFRLLGRAEVSFVDSQEKHSGLILGAMKILQEERHLEFMKKVESNRVEHLVCENCFRERMARIHKLCDSSKQKEGVVLAAIQDVVDVIRKTHYELRFIGSCLNYEFYITGNHSEESLVGRGRVRKQDGHTVFFNAPVGQHYSRDNGNLLYGIVSDEKDVIQMFESTFRSLKSLYMFEEKEEDIQHIKRVLRGCGFDIEAL
jgi:transcriptional regulator with XRE-family HTH domain